MVILVRHYQAQCHAVRITGFPHPFQSFFISLRSVCRFSILVIIAINSVFIPSQKVNSQKRSSCVCKMLHISFDVLFCAFLVSIQPVQRRLSCYAPGLSVKSFSFWKGLFFKIAEMAQIRIYQAFYRYLCTCNLCRRMIGSSGNPEWIVINPQLHSPGFQLIPHILPGFCPGIIIFGNIAVFIDGLRSFNPSVGGHHIISGLHKSFAHHPVSIGVPAFFLQITVCLKRRLVCHPVQGACADIRRCQSIRPHCRICRRLRFLCSLR